MIHTPVELPLTFLGERPYLQGTTFFDALVPFVPERARVAFRIPRLMRTDRVEVVPCKPGIDATELDAFLTWELDGDCGALGVRALPVSAEPRRTPYDEESLVRLAHFSPGCVSLNVPSPFSFCATLVSLHKALLHRELPQPTAGRWLFVRLDLDRVPGEYRTLAVTPQAVMAGGRLVKSGVTLDDVPTGDLFFSWLPKN